MDFQWWMLLPLIPLIGISLVVFKIVRVRRRGREFLRLERAEKLEFAKIVLKDGDLPIIPRLLVAAAAGYLALPIDIIPDFIPIIGHADDFLVVTLLISVITRTITPEQLDAAVRQAKRVEPGQRAIPVN